MLMIVDLELGEQKRKVIVERTIGDQVDWLVGYIPNMDDTKLNIEFAMMGVIKFTEYSDAQTAFENYKI